jgi:hypothetical protein
MFEIDQVNGEFASGSKMYPLSIVGAAARREPVNMHERVKLSGFKCS